MASENVNVASNGQGLAQLSLRRPPQGTAGTPRRGRNHRVTPREHHQSLSSHPAKPDWAPTGDGNTPDERMSATQTPWSRPTTRHMTPNYQEAW